MSVKRKQFTREEKLAWVEKLKTSGLSPAAFVASVTPDGPTKGPLQKWSKGEALNPSGGRSSGERKIKAGSVHYARVAKTPPIVMRKFASTADGELAIRILDTASVAEDIGVMRAMLAAARHLLNGIVL